MPLVHTTNIVEHGANRRTVYGSCSCGWSGRPRRNPYRATADMQRHAANPESRI